jgi:hypothetical protein
MTTPAAPARAGPGVLVVPWPSAAADRARARLAGAPCLLVVDDGVAPPTDCALDEDWTTSTSPRRDVAARIAVLAARPPRSPRFSRIDETTLDAMPDGAIALLDLLDRRRPRATPVGLAGEVVGSADDLDATVLAVREALRPAGYDVLAVPGGVLLARVSDGPGATTVRPTALDAEDRGPRTKDRKA